MFKFFQRFLIDPVRHLGPAFVDAMAVVTAECPIVFIFRCWLAQRCPIVGASGVISHPGAAHLGPAAAVWLVTFQHPPIIQEFVRAQECSVALQRIFRQQLFPIQAASIDLELKCRQQLLQRKSPRTDR